MKTRIPMLIPITTLPLTGVQRMSEEQLGEQVRSACSALGWHFLWLRKTYNSSAGILDLLIIPIRLPKGRFVTNVGGPNREYEGGDRADHKAINIAGGDAAMWQPADWYSGKILEELR